MHACCKQRPGMGEIPGPPAPPGCAPAHSCSTPAHPAAEPPQQPLLPHPQRLASAGPQGKRHCHQQAQRAAHAQLDDKASEQGGAEALPLQQMCTDHVHCKTLSSLVVGSKSLRVLCFVTSTGCSRACVQLTDVLGHIFQAAHPDLEMCSQSRTDLHKEQWQEGPCSSATSLHQAHSPGQKLQQ